MAGPLRPLLAAALVAGALFVPAAPASAEQVTEVYHLPSVDGSVIRVEVTRDTGFANVPVILTYSPYNSLGEPFPSQDSLAERYVPRGYARAYADVLGTRGSTGCWDYGGLKEQQSGADVVKFLAHQPWSNGRVAMYGGSYEGTTANMVAALGDEVPELTGIVPIAAISRWYGYAYWEGVRYFLNSTRPTDEGFDTPLAFDYGFGRTVPADPDDPHFGEILLNRAGPCEDDSLQHTEEGYSRTPDYDRFWLERDYRKDAGDFRAAVLLAHGWQDYNVKQEEGVGLFERIPVKQTRAGGQDGVPFKIMWMTQGAHSSPSGEAWQALLDAFFERVLYGVRNGVGTPRTQVYTVGRTLDEAGSYQALPQVEERSWPPRGTEPVTLHLHRKFDYDVPGMPEQPPGTGETGTLERQAADDGVWTWVDTGTSTEEISLRDPLNEPGHGYYSLFYQSAPLARNTRLAGSAVLDAWVRTQTPGGAHVTPILVDVLPSGDLRLVERGFLNLDYRNGLATAEPATGWQHGRVTFLPQDFTFPAGHRIGLIVQSSNTVWAVPGNPAGPVNIANGPVAGVTAEGSKLVLPLVKPGDPFS
jgi:X-Pro dipeptidyl-peptidase